MAFTINTNVASLEAQEYLRVSSDFQGKTINRVVSGLRIVNSGDDAAGLAIANTYRSDRAVLTQGVRNANDGLATLQTIDSGISNIGKLLDRARTLAAQSASGTFTGDRNVMNSEFSSVLGEINRQAQSIGLDTNGAFAKSLSVFIGGGRDNASSAIANGSVTVDLTAAKVDTASLGLSSMSSAKSVDLTTTIMADIRNDATNLAADSGAVSFSFYGAGFSEASGAAKISITADLTKANSPREIVDALNTEIAKITNNPTTTQAQAFKDAGIRAQVTSDGKSIEFASDKAVFMAEASNITASALMGKLANPGTDLAGLTPAANDVRFLSSGAQAQTLAYKAVTGTNTQSMVISAADSTGALHKATITIGGAATSTAQAVKQINDQLQASGDAVLMNLVAMDRTDGGGTPAPKIGFASNNPSGNGFSIALTAASASEGLNDAGGTPKYSGYVANSALNSAASSQDISTQSGAQNAVTALANAVKSLGQAQAIVGKGQNTFNFAVSLASSQLTNIAASESRIRDADLALEAANLSKAQILLQAGTAALAQANSAPQAVLSLLRG